MRNLKTRGEFSCEACGSPGIVLPANLHDDALIRCDGCGGIVAQWGAFKARAQAIVDAEHPLHRGPPAIVVRTDPVIREA